MDRISPRTTRRDSEFARPESRWLSPLVILLLALAVISPAGCGWLSLMMYNMNPDDTPADFKDLIDKKVVVVCRPVVELQFADSSVPRDLTHEVSSRMSAKIHKIHLVDDNDVSQWTDEHAWQKFTDVGKAMKADMVVGIELERFTLQQGPTLLQGNAAYRVMVYDMTDGGRVVYEKTVPRLLFPPNTPVPSAEKSEADFRRQFIGVLAEQIGRHFYPHDSLDDFATDAALNHSD
ncbi:MAG TPA: hypothetical protein VGI75_09625 [Pirellulales bacterium]|jgi:hypothetical protein